MLPADVNAETWSPWGQPGGGAPIKDRDGNALTDYNQRQVGLSLDSLRDELVARGPGMYIVATYVNNSVSSFVFVC